MDEMVELVQLPDAQTRPLVHPLDVPEARRPFRTGWLIGVLAGPAVGVAVGAAALSVSKSIVVAVLAGAPVVVIGYLASRYFREDAWSFIPRKRQDRTRPLPARWDMAEGTVVAISIVATVIFLSGWILDASVPLGVRQFVVGSGVAAALLVAVDMASSRFLHRGSFVGRRWLAIPIMFGVAISVWYAWVALLPQDQTLFSTATLLGVTTMLIAGLLVWGWELLESHRRVANGA